MTFLELVQVIENLPPSFLDFIRLTYQTWHGMTYACTSFFLFGQKKDQMTMPKYIALLGV